MTASGFRFRLERVRQLRERREDLAREELAAAMADGRRSEDEHAEAVASLQSARRAHLATAGSRRTVSELMAGQSYLERAERIQAARRADVEQHEHRIAERRGVLTEAARDRQALERLKEQRRVEHEAELARVEGLALDEMALTIFRRRAA